MMAGLICPYCKKPSEHVSSTEVYSKDYGMIYLCRPCNAYVGCHQDGRSKGRLANKKLRKLKIDVHFYFDKIWKSDLMKRKEAYKWLSKKLEIPAEYTHIGMFNEKTCAEVVYACKQYLNDNRRLDMDFNVEPITPYYEL